jgi:pimeloyl-ACP methyl ester carboxylesterase
MKRFTNMGLVPWLLSWSALLLSGTALAEGKVRSGYQPVNGLQMYYEIHGSGRPLVLIHGGGSTIGTTFGQVLAPLAKHRQVIAVELQAHGHTADIDRPLSFAQDADDVAALLARLKIERADILGFSNGGQTAMQIAIRHPALVRRLVVASGFYKRSGVPAQFWEGMAHATLDNMPQGLKDAYLAIVPDPKRLRAMFERDKQRMLTFQDWKDDDLRAIKAPTLLLAGDQDVMLPEHIVQMYRLLPHGRMAILPGAHGAYLGEATVTRKGSPLPPLTVAMVEEFLDGTE